MTCENIYNLIEFDNYSLTPKYLQLANAISKNVDENRIVEGYVLPSINCMAYEIDISRTTVEKAYKYLKDKGYIIAIPGKGYYVHNINTTQQIRVFMLFNKLSVHKKMIYDAFAKALGHNVIIDFYIYNNDFSLFKKILTEVKTDYSYYIIIPHFLDEVDNAHEIIIRTVPDGKLILMSLLLNGLRGDYGAIYEDFEQNIYDSLYKAIERLRKYEKLNIIFPKYTYHPNTILKGFTRFCQDYAFDYHIISDIDAEILHENSIYISLMEDGLVTLVKKTIEAGLVVGENVGIISYNETPIKQIILNGITTISADFRLMGEKAAQMVLSNSLEHFSVPFNLTIRESL